MPHAAVVMQRGTRLELRDIGQHAQELAACSELSLERPNSVLAEYWLIRRRSKKPSENRALHPICVV